MASERASSVTPEYALLGLLCLAPGHGYELHARLRRELGAVWTVRQNQVYNILRRLETEGFVRTISKGTAESRSPRTLRLTPAGRRRFDTWLREPTGLSIRALRVDFLTRLYFARRLYPQSAPQLVRAQLRTTRKGVEEMEARYEATSDSGSLEAMSHNLRLQQLRLAVRWLEDLSTREGSNIRPRGAPHPSARSQPNRSRKKG